MQQQYADVFELLIQGWEGLDETAALLKKPWCLYQVMDALDEGLLPNKMRFVVVRGAVDVLPQTGEVSKAYSEAFHIAVAEMVALKRHGFKFSCQTGYALFNAAWQTQVNLM